MNSERGLGIDGMGGTHTYREHKDAQNHTCTQGCESAATDKKKCEKTSVSISEKLEKNQSDTAQAT